MKPACDCATTSQLHLPTCALIRWERSGNCDRARDAAPLADMRKELEEVEKELHYAESHLSSLQQRRASLRYRIMQAEDKTGI